LKSITLNNIYSIQISKHTGAVAPLYSHFLIFKKFKISNKYIIFKKFKINNKNNLNKNNKNKICKKNLNNNLKQKRFVEK